jgi:ribosomal protein S15P/S13E
VNPAYHTLSLNYYKLAKHVSAFPKDLMARDALTNLESSVKSVNSNLLTEIVTNYEERLAKDELDSKFRKKPKRKLKKDFDDDYEDYN